LDFVSGETVATRHAMDRGADQNAEAGPVKVNEWKVRRWRFDRRLRRTRTAAGSCSVAAHFSKSARSGAPLVVTLPML